MFAAVLLHEIYGFSLLEIADFIADSEDAVQSALIEAEAAAVTVSSVGYPNTPVDLQTRLLAQAFVDAMNSGEVSELKDLMAEHVQLSLIHI